VNGTEYGLGWAWNATEDAWDYIGSAIQNASEAVYNLTTGAAS